ncbi:MAG: L-2-hydroxyglutarate oxidase [Actinobacteria bacterium]|jgi:L-2-hydroxyglutarate oxidase|nr:L-2-hydroxyglutarate oxidase [Actinomycetota bacterium]MBT3688023.1 L-2-hydroxyglutarate oxidase [Actinomycetota bacterium]MBT4036860.1 L-2-hydroxyglutarate oxidase [Actinomycetota bacterium]MBT4278510.1 L-2-hydroxyglutarate oxidase [Actinomycetota bacterium]MBT4343741.1 L-2-hydroxyglutarate oxidase [Actinomycetota bacterium]
MADSPTDVLVVGAGIVGLATADALQLRLPGIGVTVLEKELEVAAHQTGHNSGVLHAGIYYTPGSRKADLAVSGIESMVDFCVDNAIPHDRCGKLVVATTPDEAHRLEILAERAGANGVAVSRLSPEAAQELEPDVACVAALHVPSTGRADFVGVANELARRITSRGGSIRTGVECRRAAVVDGNWLVDTSDEPVRARYLLGCAGLHSDRVARRSGTDPAARIIPFRGEYLDVTGPSADLVRGLIYPVADPRLPFLGVHLTRGLDGQVHAGPNAVLALSREGYRWRDASARDLAESLSWPGSLRLAGRYWRVGLAESARSLSTRRFAASAQELVPGLDPADFARATSGVRAQAVDVRGNLLDDFHLVGGDMSLHVINAPSPAATAALEIGKLVADQVAVDLPRRAS